MTFKMWLEATKDDLSNVKRHHPEYNADHWGFHLLLDLSQCNSNIKDKVKIKDFIKQLIKTIKMKAVGETIIRNFGEGDTAGYSAMQLISTSSITLHAVNKFNSLYLDIFSCKDFEKEKAIDLAKEYFQPKYIKSKFLYRDAKK